MPIYRFLCTVQPTGLFILSTLPDRKFMSVDFDSMLSLTLLQRYLHKLHDNFKSNLMLCYFVRIGFGHYNSRLQSNIYKKGKCHYSLHYLLVTMRKMVKEWRMNKFTENVKAQEKEEECTYKERNTGTPCNKIYHLEPNRYRLFLYK